MHQELHCQHTLVYAIRPNTVQTKASKSNDLLFWLHVCPESVGGYVMKLAKLTAFLNIL